MLLTSADNVTLLAFAAEQNTVLLRRLRSIDIRSSPGPQQQTLRSGMQRSLVRQTDGQTDGRAPYRYIDPAAYYAVSKIVGKIKTRKTRHD